MSCTVKQKKLILRLPGSRCEPVQAENFARDALNALKFCKEYAECAESWISVAECAEYKYFKYLSAHFCIILAYF